MPDRNEALPVLVAGGGIGGLAAALALTRQGFRVKVLEQALRLGEIGAGIQLGPNAFAAFDALGIGHKARGHAVYIDEMVMHDALDETLVGRIPTAEASRQRFDNRYAVIPRADVHKSLLEGVHKSKRIELLTSTAVQCVEQDDDGVTVNDSHGNTHGGVALVGADGVKSAVRRQYVGDDARVSGHVVYRNAVDKRDFPTDLQWNAASIWVGPNCHLVHYPLRGGEQYNVVVTFHGRAGGSSLRQGLRALRAFAHRSHRSHRSHRALGARNGPHLPRSGCGAPRSQRAVEGPHAGALLRRDGVALPLESGKLLGLTKPESRVRMIEPAARRSRRVRLAPT